MPAAAYKTQHSAADPADRAAAGPLPPQTGKVPSDPAGCRSIELHGNGHPTNKVTDIQQAR